MIRRYSAHGLAISSEIELTGLRTDDGSEHPDLVIRRASGPILTSARESVAEHLDHAGTFRADRRPDGSYLVEFGDVLTLIVDERATVVNVHGDHDDPVVGMLVAGGGVSFVLTVRGTLNLHASAVSLGDRAAVLVAPRGHGKSLVAALACAEGAELLTDDLCAITFSNDDALALPGSTTLRLRHDPDHVRRLFPDSSVALTPDGRTAVRPPTRDVPIAISTLVFVVPGDADVVNVKPLAPAAVLGRLLGNLRTPGILGVDLIGPQFEGCAELANRVDLIELVMPRHPNSRAVAVALFPERCVQSG